MQHLDAIQRSLLVIVGLLLIPGLAVAQPTIDGDLSDSQYQTIAMKLSSNSSFGTAIDVQEIVYYADDHNDMLYVGIKGQFDTSRDDGIGLWLNVTGSGAPSGRPPGTALAVSGGGHYISGDEGANADFAADFEVDAMYAFNSGGTSTDIFFDAANVFGGSARARFVGRSDQSGTATTGTGPGGETITFAVDNSGSSNTGGELQIPFAELNATASMGGEAFAMVVGSEAFFSDVTVPGYVTTGSLGYNPDYSTLAGGPYHSTPLEPLPVELFAFDAVVDGQTAQLTWTTASETSNAGFAVQHAAPGAGFERVGWKNGAGTTDEARSYTFEVDGLSAGTHRFRLKQVDRDGPPTLSEVVKARVDLSRQVVVTNVAPNPVRRQATLQVGVKEARPVTVALYNLLGQKVRTLHRGTLPSGKMTTIDVTTATLSSGVYVVRVQGASFRETRRLTVVK
jgi:hypothetical protein